MAALEKRLFNVRHCRFGHQAAIFHLADQGEIAGQVGNDCKFEI